MNVDSYRRKIILPDQMNSFNKYFILFLTVLSHSNWHFCAAFSPAPLIVKQRTFVGTAKSPLWINDTTRTNPLVRYETLSQNEERSVREIDSVEIFVILIPLLTMALAFFQYDSTAQLFHDFVISASGRQFELVE
jgi:hypothetical protein